MSFLSNAKQSSPSSPSNWSVRNHEMRKLEAQRFWHSFNASDWSRRDVSELIPFIWIGIPQISPPEVRQGLYQLAVQRFHRSRSPTRTEDSTKLPKTVFEQIGIELGMENCFSRIGEFDDSQRDVVRRIVTAHAVSSNALTYVPGIAQLAALLLKQSGGSEELTLGVLQALLDAVQNYFADQHVCVRRDILVLADIIVTDFPELAQHLNSIQFDVVDLSDCACIWIVPLFVYHFPIQFVLRLIDLLLFQGSSVLLPVLFGVLAISSTRMLEISDAAALYTFFSTLPDSIKPSEIDDIFSLAAELSEDKIRLETLQTEKDWLTTMDLKSIPRFVDGVGSARCLEGSCDLISRVSATKLNHSTKLSSETTLSKITETSSSENTFTNVKDRVKMPGTISGGVMLHSIFDHKNSTPETSKNEPLVNENANLKTKLNQSALELVSMREQVETLTTKLSTLEAKQAPHYGSQREQGSKANTSMLSSAHSVVLGVNTQLNAIHSDINAHNKKGNVDESEPLQRFRSFSFGQMHEVFSRVHEILEFPCIYIEGYLMKLSRTGLFGRRVLHRRWFVLKGRYLTYFKSPLHTKPHKDRCSSIRGATISRIGNHPKGEWALTIGIEDKKGSRRNQYLLFASSCEELDRWAASLEISAHAE